MRPPRDALLLLALAGLLLLVGLGAVALTDRDEGANAEAAREMLEARAWITPTLGGAPRFAKPAFVYWLTAGAYAALGVGETAARLPSAVAALLLVLVQYAFARWAFGRDVAWRAALVLLLSVEYVAIGRMALTDATLALWTTVAGYAFLRGWWGAAAARPLVRARLDRRRARGARQGAGGTPDPACRGGRLPPARGRPPPGMAGGVAAPRPRALPPGRRTVVRRHVLDPRLGLRRASAGRDPRPRAPARDRAGRDGALLRPRPAPGLLPLERVPAGSRRRGAPPGARSGPAAPGGRR